MHPSFTHIPFVCRYRDLPAVSSRLPVCGQNRGPSALCSRLHICSRDHCMYKVRKQYVTSWPCSVNRFSLLEIRYFFNMLAVMVAQVSLLMNAYSWSNNADVYLCCVFHLYHRRDSKWCPWFLCDMPSWQGMHRLNVSS